MAYSVTGRRWGKRWSAEKIARVEIEAARLGDLERFVVASPLFPVGVVAGAYGLFAGAHWFVGVVAGAILG